jgi:hypothetical protein
VATADQVKALIRCHAEADPVAAQNHYRDDGCWGAFEIKLGERQVEDAATNLKCFA